MATARYTAFPTSTATYLKDMAPRRGPQLRKPASPRAQSRAEAAATLIALVGKALCRLRPPTAARGPGPAPRRLFCLVRACTGARTRQSPSYDQTSPHQKRQGSGAGEQTKRRSATSRAARALPPQSQRAACPRDLQQHPLPLLAATDGWPITWRAAAGGALGLMARWAASKAGGTTPSPPHFVITVCISRAGTHAGGMKRQESYRLPDLANCCGLLLHVQACALSLHSNAAQRCTGGNTLPAAAAARCAALRCTALYCAVLRCTVLYCAVPRHSPPLCTPISPNRPASCTRPTTSSTV